MTTENADLAKKQAARQVAARDMGYEDGYADRLLLEDGGEGGNKKARASLQMKMLGSAACWAAYNEGYAAGTQND